MAFGIDPGLFFRDWLFYTELRSFEIPALWQ
jgi:hypothetical protein